MPNAVSSPKTTYAQTGRFATVSVSIVLEDFREDRERNTRQNEGTTTPKG